jgi:hypothetical protein
MRCPVRAAAQMAHEPPVGPSGQGHDAEKGGDESGLELLAQDDGFTPLTGATALTPFVIDEFGCGLALAGVLVAYVFWSKRAELPQAVASS